MRAGIHRALVALAVTAGLLLAVPTARASSSGDDGRNGSTSIVGELAADLWRLMMQLLGESGSNACGESGSNLDGESGSNLDGESGSNLAGESGSN